MIKAIINGLMSLVTSILDIVLLPVNALIENIFPDMSNAINTFSNFVSTYIGGSIGYFASILPPISRSIIILWFTFLISYYGVVWSYTAIIKIWNVIQKIKFW